MWLVSSEQDYMLASFLVGRGNGQYEYAPARVHKLEVHVREHKE